MAFGIRWLKPEIDEPKYYLHVGILILVSYWIMTNIFHTPFTELSIPNIFKLIVATTLGDVIAHTILKLS